MAIWAIDLERFNVAGTVRGGRGRMARRFRGDEPILLS
jgi:hypothetical protein